MKTKLIEFLKQLASAQDATLGILKKKQKLLVQLDPPALEAIVVEERDALDQLRSALAQREAILQTAQNEGIEADSIQQLCETLFPHNVEVRRLLDIAQNRSKQLRFLALTNWTMSQKSMIHLSQLIELIETRGHGKTTYKPTKGTEGGGLVDRVA